MNTRRQFVLTTIPATATLGACSAVGGTLVAANGWCAIWAKKA